MEEALERAQMKAQAASASCLRCIADEFTSLCLRPCCSLSALLSCLSSSDRTSVAGGCFGACFPPEIPTDHPTVLRIAETKDMAESLKDRKLVMTLHTEKVNKLIASMAKEASGQRN